MKRFLHVEWGGDSHAGRHSENPDNALAKITAGKGADERAGDASLFGGSTRVSKDSDWSESDLCNLVDCYLKEQADNGCAGIRVRTDGLCSVASEGMESAFLNL